MFLTLIFATILLAAIILAHASPFLAVVLVVYWTANGNEQKVGKKTHV